MITLPSVTTTPSSRCRFPPKLKSNNMRSVDRALSNRSSLLFCRTTLSLSARILVRPLDLRIVVLTRETVPEFVISIPLGNVAVTFRRFVAAEGLERAVGQAVEVKVCAALLQSRAGLEDL